MTSTPFCILPAVKLNNLNIGNGKPGPVTKSLLDKWSELVSVDIISQIKKWDTSDVNNTQTTPYKFNKPDENHKK